MTQIYLIRHAEAEGNLYRRAQGHYDGAITRRGHMQIDKLAERLRNVHFDALYSSDLRRTMTTATAITRYHDVALRTTPRLREVAMGCWEDLPWGNVEHQSKEQLVSFNTDPESWDIEGGESFGDLVARIRSIILELAGKHNGQTIAIVSHGMAIRAFISSVMGIGSKDINTIAHSDNTAVSMFEVENGQVKINYINDNSHLSSSLSTFAGQNWWKQANGIDKYNLRFEPMNPKKEKELYVQCYANTWLAAHGSLSGFDGSVYLDNAINHYRKNPLSLMKAMTGDTFVGLIELDLERGKEVDAGWISLCYMVADFRGQRLGVQLIGHAVSIFRTLGRNSIRLHVAESNSRAYGFYEGYGFKKIGTENGVLSKLFLMEKDI